MDNREEIAEDAAYIAMLAYESYQTTGDIAYINNATTMARIAAATIPDEHHSRAGFLNNLAVMLNCQYQRTEQTQILEEATQVARQAVELTPGGDPARADWLDSLANILESKFERTGNIEALQEAIEVAQEAVATCAKDSPGRPALLNNVSNKLVRQFKLTENLEVLEDAIRTAQQAVDTTPKGQPDRAAYLSNLGSKLEIRYEITGQKQDLEDAIVIAREAEAIELTPDTNPDRIRFLSNLGGILESQYTRTGDMQILQDSIRTTQEAIDQTAGDFSGRASSLNNLANLLQRIFERTGETHYIDEAIRAAQEAVESTQDNHPDLPGRLNNLGSNLNTLGQLLHRRYDLKADMQDLERAITVTQDAINSTPKDHPDQAAYLQNLGLKLASRAERTGDITHLKDALQCFLETSKQPQALPLTRVRGARGAIAILQELGEWNQANMIAQAAVNLLPIICSRYASRDDQQYAIIQTSGLAADTGSILLKTGNVEKALEYMELGRGLILSYMIDDRSDWSELERASDTLAERYKTLHIKASMPIGDQEPMIRAQLLKERREAGHEIEACIAEIRQKAPGQERFLLGPSIEELKTHALEGPIVVVNVTDIAADAIIVSHNQIKSLPLPGLSSATAPQLVKQQFRRYLSFRRGNYNRDIGGETEDEIDPDLSSWLWSNCVKLVLEELNAMGLTSPETPRVWWIGSGIASSFPFHAAGTNSENSIDHIISSYTPTIKALGYSRARASMLDKPDDKNSSILVVTMPTTPGQKPLKGANREKLVIESASYGIYSVRELRCPTVLEVLEQIPTSGIIHFACHGSSDPTDPSRSHLILQRDSEEPEGVPVVDRLTISRISRVAAQGQARIAFLSACSTAEVKASKLRDESLHLTSAFQVAGFASVIGSQWPVDDDVCVRLAESFYANLIGDGHTFSNRRVAEALRNAVMHVRAEYPESPYVWSPFVHFGA
ncbi:TPR-like protein [Stipitochalara longipes BDJ]|nr:TPR-like protein [Stipitochalara longipes BDJ]